MDVELHWKLVARPEHLEELINGSPQRKTIVIDEVQKVPELLTVVHDFIERKQELRFILTGSSARKLKRSGMDLLAGRATVSFCHVMNFFGLWCLMRRFRFNTQEWY